MFLPDYSLNFRQGTTVHVRNAEGERIGFVHRIDGLYQACGRNGEQVNNGHAYDAELDAVNGVWDHEKRAQSLSKCSFCDSIAGLTETKVYAEWPETVAYHPRRGGVADGHLVVVPREHVFDAGHSPGITARTMFRAAEIVAQMPSANIITSKSITATQTAFHLHIHVVPRTVGDRLPLPWTELSCGCA